MIDIGLSKIPKELKTSYTLRYVMVESEGDPLFEEAIKRINLHDLTLISRLDTALTRVEIIINLEDTDKSKIRIHPVYK